MPKQSHAWTEGLRSTAAGRKLWLRALPWQCAATNSHTPGFMGATRAACVSRSEEVRTITCHKKTRIHSQEERLELHISKKKKGSRGGGQRCVARFRFKWFRTLEINGDWRSQLREARLRSSAGGSWHHVPRQTRVVRSWLLFDTRRSWRPAAKFARGESISPCRVVGDNLWSLVRVDNVVIDLQLPTQLTAQSKPDGGVRGIVAGDVIRRLVARTMAKQLRR